MKIVPAIITVHGMVQYVYGLIKYFQKKILVKIGQMILKDMDTLKGIYGTMYSLYREDGSGDSGGTSIVLWEDNGEVKMEHNAKPRIGVCIQVGSSYARTMQWQDWWQTSYITEILEEREDYIKFKTKNSTYEWKVI